ncbi:MAG: Tfp pilus assembly protein FimT/FimU [Candidatus Babeliales bacterium]
MMRSQEQGSLLLNIALVLSILLVLMSIAIPRLPFMQRMVLRLELEKMHSFFHYMQQRALALHEDLTITFDPIHNRYYADTYKESLAPGVQFGVLLGSSGPPSKPSGQILSPITFKNNKAVFYKDGTIAAGTVYITDHSKHYLYALSSPVSQISYLRMYSYARNRWIPLQ